MWTKPLLLLSFIYLFFLLPSYAQASTLLVNEIMAAPSSGESEWIEIYNSSSSSIDLTRWIIQEKTSSGNFTSYTLPSTSISSNSYYVYEFSGSKLNNDGDTVNLLNPQGTIEDTYTFTNAPSALSFSRVPNGENWSSSTSPSKGSTNGNSQSAPTSSPTSSPTPSPTSTPIQTTIPATFSISNVPSEIKTDQLFSVKINLVVSGGSNTTYYLKGAFKKDDPGKYFGLTKNNNSWIEYGDDYTKQYKISTDAIGSWSGNLEIKVDTYDSDYAGSGDYIFKVARITTGGSSTWSNETNIKIVNQTLSSSTPTSTPKLIATTTISPSPTAISKKVTVSNSQSSSVAGVISTPISSSSPFVVVKGDKEGITFISLTGFLIIIIGIGLGVYIYFQDKIKFPSWWKHI